MQTFRNPLRHSAVVCVRNDARKTARHDAEMLMVATHCEYSTY